jgi:hypothetical protein
MKLVPDEFTSKGFKYTKVKREGDKAIYKQSHNEGTNFRYEVVVIGQHNGYKLGDSYIEPSEVYPGSSLWGIKGWTCITLEDAEIKYKNLSDTNINTNNEEVSESTEK